VDREAATVVETKAVVMEAATAAVTVVKTRVAAMAVATVGETKVADIVIIVPTPVKAPIAAPIKNSAILLEYFYVF